MAVGRVTFGPLVPGPLPDLRAPVNALVVEEHIAAWIERTAAKMVETSRKFPPGDARAANLLSRAGELQGTAAKIRSGEWLKEESR